MMFDSYVRPFDIKKKGYSLLVAANTLHLPVNSILLLQVMSCCPRQRGQLQGG